MTLFDAHGNPIVAPPKGPEPLELALPGGDEPLTAAQAEAAKDFYAYARLWMRLARHVEATPPKSRQAAKSATMKLDRYARKCDAIGARHLKGLTLAAFLEAIRAAKAREVGTAEA